MTHEIFCPSLNELRLLTEGRLEHDRFGQVLAHVEVCDKCFQLIEGLDESTSDPFIQSLESITASDLLRAKDQLNQEAGTNGTLGLWSLLEEKISRDPDEYTLSIPCQLGPYQVNRLIARGGMGEVYQAEHVRLRRSVALKVIRNYRQDDTEMRQRFLKEMESVGKFDHPNLVRAYEAWEEKGCLYIIFEYLNGQSLQQLAIQGSIHSESEVLDILTGVLQALEELHSHQMVHCDVKPANIIRLKDGTVKLIDFGLVVRQDTTSQDKTSVVGTRKYMSPEQKSNDKHVDIRSDIYSTGLVIQFLLRCLTNAPAGSQEEEIRARLTRISDRMTKQSPDERYQQVSDIIEELEYPCLNDVSRTVSGRLKLLSYTALILLLPGLGWVSKDVLYHKSQNMATVQVNNHLKDDSIVLTSADGTRNVFKLADSPKFEIKQGNYLISLATPLRRKVIPEKILIQENDVLKIEITQPRAPFDLKMVPIPAGEFVMGAVSDDPLAKPHESPRRTVRFHKPFQMSAFEITVGQFREFVESTGYVTEAERSGEGGWKASHATGWSIHGKEYLWSSPGYNLKEDLPVTQVSYADCMAFCDWLSLRESKKYRLPTEAEWEYACRAGSNQVNFFPPDERDDYCWSAWNSKGTARPDLVGKRKPNAWGLYDMCGNVREWCLDWYHEKGYELPIDSYPAGPETGTSRVIRGGCFIDMNPYLRSSQRGVLEPFHALNNQGFRVVQTPDENVSLINK